MTLRHDSTGKPIVPFAPAYPNRAMTGNPEDMTTVDAMKEALKNPAFAHKWGDVLAAKHTQIAQARANQQASNVLNGHVASTVADSAVVTGELAGHPSTNAPKAAMTASRKTRNVTMDSARLAAQRPGDTLGREGVSSGTAQDGNFTPKGWEQTPYDAVGNFLPRGEEQRDTDPRTVAGLDALGREGFRGTNSAPGTMSEYDPVTTPGSSGIGFKGVKPEPGDTRHYSGSDPRTTPGSSGVGFKGVKASVDSLLPQLAKTMDALFAGIRARGGIPRIRATTERKPVTTVGIRTEDAAHRKAVEEAKASDREYLATFEAMDAALAAPETVVHKSRGSLGKPGVSVEYALKGATYFPLDWYWDAALGIPRPVRGV